MTTYSTVEILKIGLTTVLLCTMMATTALCEDDIDTIASGQIEVDETYATCGSCWCVPEDGGEGECPPDSEKPATEWPDMTIENMLTMELANPMTLECDPYAPIEEGDDGCQTSPPLVDGNACVYEVFPRDDFVEVSPTSTTTATAKQSDVETIIDAGLTCTADYMYRLITVEETVEEALEKGMAVTHSGACGACSSLQDLVVYMTKPDLAEIGTKCGARGLTNFTRGVQCFRDQGFTHSCAFTWMANAQFTKETCGPECITHTLLELPNNLPPPTCYLAECIECDEQSSGPLFQLFSGRTRRSSGLLSGIARNCSSISNAIQHEDPCMYADDGEGDDDGDDDDNDMPTPPTSPTSAQTADAPTMETDELDPSSGRSSSLIGSSYVVLSLVASWMALVVR